MERRFTKLRSVEEENADLTPFEQLKFQYIDVFVELDNVIPLEPKEEPPDLVA
jgi:hypothetical protein